MSKIFSEAEKERIRENLLRKGFESMLEKGYKATIISDLVKEAGIAKGTFYNFFPNKEEFTIQLLIKQYDVFYDMIREEMKKTDLSEKERIHNVVMNIAQNKNHRFFFLRLNELVEISRCLSAESMSVYKREQKLFYKELVTLLGKDPDVCKPGVVGNLLTLLLAPINSLESMPFFFTEDRDDTIFYEAHMLFHYIVTH